MNDTSYVQGGSGGKLVYWLGDVRILEWSFFVVLLCKNIEFYKSLFCKKKFCTTLIFYLVDKWATLK